MINELRENIEEEIEIIFKMRTLQRQLEIATGKQKESYERSFDSLKQQLRILNDSVPSLLAGISPVKKLEGGGLKGAYPTHDSLSGLKNLSRANLSLTHSKIVLKSKGSKVMKDEEDQRFVTIDPADKERFEQELGIYGVSLKKLKKLEKSKKTGEEKPSQIAGISNKIFSGVSEGIAPSFGSLKDDLKKANLRFSISTYLSIAIFVSILVFLGSLVLWIILMIIGVLGILHIWIPFVLTLACVTGFYLYPASEKGSVGKRIADELPFVTIHMAAIAGSNLEPTRIFKIIASSPEYPTVGLEMKKIVNQVEVYGYDLVSALRNATKSTPNRRLADLFSGLSTNIVSGGDLKDYLEKKADNFLRDYKLERKRYTSLAETFMDIYISVMITAPLILVVMLIIMNVTGLSIGLSFPVAMGLIIGIVVLINIIFLIALEVKQPRV